MAEKNIPSMAELKQAARKLAEREGLKHMAALERAARDVGFADYRAFVEQDKWRQPRPALPAGFIDDVVEAFRREALDKGVDFSLFWPTQTGLGKSIVDATAPVRLHFAAVGLHDYASQQKGPDHKVRISAYLVRADREQPAFASFYRPVTKNGDPRMWFSGLPYFARPGDTIAIIVDNGVPCLVNLQELATDLAAVLLPLGVQHAGQGRVKLSAWQNYTQLGSLARVVDLLDRAAVAKDSLALELVGELRKVASRGRIAATVSGSTAVGRAVEHALGINQNSSKDPDYKGQIELKAARAKPPSKRTRQTLFAQVADWDHAKTTFKSSAKILAEYGYARGENNKLYCTVSAKVANSQGLSFQFSDDESLLMEVDKHGVVVAVWPLELLAKRLLKKHAETFWIKVQSSRDLLGVEHFTLLSATHTKAPLTSQLVPLIRAGLITMDHLIKRREDGSVSEKGPLFKLSHEGFDLLFPNPTYYSLKPGEEQ